MPSCAMLRWLSSGAILRRLGSHFAVCCFGCHMEPSSAILEAVGSRREGQLSIVQIEPAPNLR